MPLRIFGPCLQSIQLLYIPLWSRSGSLSRSSACFLALVSHAVGVCLTLDGLGSSHLQLEGSGMKIDIASALIEQEMHTGCLIGVLLKLACVNIQCIQLLS